MFSSEYATRGIVMLKSLQACCTDYHLFIIAFDNPLYQYLKKQNFPNVTPISMAEFEDETLLKAKSSRTLQEYCWTCEPLSIQYCLTHYDIDNCTYLDADLYFYTNPNELVDEMGDNDVLLTEHRYTPDVVPYAGRFCVQFLTIRRTENGMQILKWWCDRCLEWCYARHEHGQYGDQVYLDVFPEKFKKVHILQNEGGGVAPWNMQQYEFYEKDSRLMIRNLASKKEYPVVFFHCHAIFIFNKGPIIVFCFINYPNPKHIMTLLIRPYVKELLREYKRIPLHNTLNLKEYGSYENITWKTFFHRYMRHYNDAEWPYIYTLKKWRL